MWSIWWNENWQEKQKYSKKAHRGVKLTANCKGRMEAEEGITASNIGSCQNKEDKCEGECVRIGTQTHICTRPCMSQDILVTGCGLEYRGSISTKLQITKVNSLFYGR
jgi:hypothetical protein